MTAANGCALDGGGPGCGLPGGTPDAETAGPVGARAGPLAAFAAVEAFVPDAAPGLGASSDAQPEASTNSPASAMAWNERTERNEDFMNNAVNGPTRTRRGF